MPIGPAIGDQPPPDGVTQSNEYLFDKSWQLHFAKDYAELIQAIPDPVHIASRELKTALVKKGYRNIDPDRVFYNRFTGAISSSRSYNGWEHRETPIHSYTLTQAVMLNVFGEFLDSPPNTIDLYTGIYTQGADGTRFNERNEVRLLSSALWNIAYYDLDVQKSYTEVLSSFWKEHGKRYTQLIRDSYAFSAHQQYRLGLLDQAQYQLASSLLKSRRPNNINVYRFDIYGYDSTDMLLIEQQGGNAGLLYIPGAEQPFIAYDSERQLKKYLFKSLGNVVNRNAMAKHFSLYLRQNGTSYSGVDSALEGFATGSWDNGYMMMKHRPINGDVFARITEQVRTRQESDGDTLIKSNSESQRDYYLSVAYSVMTLFPVIDLVAPEVGIPLGIGLSSTQFGLNLDKALHGDTLAERMEGTRMSAVNAAALGATTLLPALAQYGRALSRSIETVSSELESSIILNRGFPTAELDHFAAMPRIIIHPQTGEELLGVRLTQSGRGALLRANGWGFYREVDAASGRLLDTPPIRRALDLESGEPQWLERAGLQGGNPQSNEVISSDGSPHSELPDILLPEDLPTRPGIGGSGYADMTGGRDIEAARDFWELEQKVDPQAYLTDVKALHRTSQAAQQEATQIPFLQSYQPELKGALVFRGDTRLPDELFHAGFNRRVEPVRFVELAEHTRGIRGVVSTTLKERIAVNYALHNQRGYVYAIELNHGGRAVDTTVRYLPLHEVATLNIPPEDIMFAIGPFTNLELGYSDLLEQAEHRTAELLINPHATASPEVALQAFDRLKSMLRYDLSPEMSFAERYANRTDLFWHEDEALPDQGQ
uniref:Putative cytotoxic necrotizing factor n=2 Tax=Shewanella TaxID=22 RepID=A0A2U9DS48_9GAMM|nr:putative cytotoxic necrotizing factor [Shewanella baltica]